MRPEILDLEQCADLPAGALGNNERARLGQHLQPGRQVRRLADDPAFLRRAGTDQVADDDEPAGNPEPHSQLFRRGQAADRLDDGEPGAHRPLGVVLMRLGIAEIDQHPVAHIFGEQSRQSGRPCRQRSDDTRR